MTARFQRRTGTYVVLALLAALVIFRLLQEQQDPQPPEVLEEGVSYEVDPDVAGETVVLWWGLFDQDLYIEHGDKRYGPYTPVGGPIPLDRYRRFKKTAYEKRADRIMDMADDQAAVFENIQGIFIQIFWNLNIATPRARFLIGLNRPAHGFW